MPRGQQQLELRQLAVSPFELELLADVRHTLERLGLFVQDALGGETPKLDAQLLLLTRLVGNHGARCMVPR